MSASVISMEDWKREKFIQWAEAFTIAALEAMPPKDRKRAERHIMQMCDQKRGKRA